MAKKKILYIITKSVWGGPAKYVLDLAANLPKESFEIFAAAGGQAIFSQRIQENKIPYYEINAFQRQINPFKEILAFFEILSLLFKLKPDIIHTNSSKAGGIAGLAGWLYRLIAGQKVLIVFTAHGWALSEQRTKWQLLLIKLASWLTSFFCDQIICVSEFDKKIALENKIAPTEKLTVIHNGLETGMDFLSKEQAQEKLLNKTIPFLIGTIAEMTRNKGLLYLLQAISPEQVLVIIAAGENPQEKEIRAFISRRRLKNVLIYKNLENAASYLKSFDVFVLPSVKEGLPYVLIEAMLAQVPIIATYVGGIPELVEDNVHGFLVKPKNSQLLAEKIIELKDNPQLRRKLSQCSREKIEKEFGLEQMIKQTTDIYQKN